MKHGLIRMDASDGHIIAQYKIKPGVEKNRNLNCITNDYISQVHLSPDGKRVYASTSMGLCCLDIAENSWTTEPTANTLTYTGEAQSWPKYDVDGLVGEDEITASVTVKNTGDGRRWIAEQRV